MPKAAGKWNTYEVTAKGRDITVTLNGQQTAKLNNGMFEEGPFTLAVRLWRAEGPQVRGEEAVRAIAALNSRGTMCSLLSLPRLRGRERVGANIL